MAKKAARGAGYPWGLADEAGRATRWLCLHGFDGCAGLAALLARFDGGAVRAWAPRLAAGRYEAEGGCLCPLISGAFVSDRATALAADPMRFGPLVEPLLILPFAAAVSQRRQSPVTVTWDRVAAVLDGDAVSFAEDRLPSGHLQIALGGQPGALRRQTQRAVMREEVWTALDQWASRTYAPATDASRARGAGGVLPED